MSSTIHHEYKCFQSTVQRDKDRRQKFYFCRLPFDVTSNLISEDFFITVFESLRSYLSTPEAGHFQNDSFSKRSTFETVSITSVFIGVFDRFSADIIGETDA